MTKYQCGICEKIFNIRSDLIRHKNRKYPCNKKKLIEIDGDYIECEIDDEECDESCDNDDRVIVINKTNNKEICKYCKKQYSTHTSIVRHQKFFCKEKNKINDNDESNTAVLEKIKQLEEKIKELENAKRVPLTNNTNNSHNNTTNTMTNSMNTINNVTINMYGKEDLSHLTVRDFKRVFKRCNLSVPEFIQLKHFDENKPENSNIYISNLRSDYIMVFDGDKWVIADKDTTIQNLYDDNCGMLIEKFEDLKEHLDQNTQNKFNRFIDKHDEEETINNTKKEIKQILYNERAIPLKNKKINVEN